MALPRKFLNEDEELLAELRPHWIFLFGPLFTSIGVWAGSSCCWSCGGTRPVGPTTRSSSSPSSRVCGSWAAMSAGRSYDVALTSTRILVRQGILGRDTVNYVCSASPR